MVIEYSHLSLPQLEEVRDALTERVRCGLSQPGQEVLALPAYLSPPRHDVKGEALVVDAGGTNMRAAWVRLGEESELLAGPLSGSLPDGRDQPVGRQEFFAKQAQLVHQLGAHLELPLGYCFSYPAEVLPSGDARLLAWTKGIQVEGVVGIEVGRALAQAIGPVTGVTVLNDTVAALMGGAYAGRKKHQYFIGLIAGTGANMATFVSHADIGKLDHQGPGMMAVNLESGNFHPPTYLPGTKPSIGRAIIQAVSASEKAVSGYYLPYIMEQLCPQLAGFDPKAGTGQLVEIRQKGENAEAVRAAAYVLDRSADLVAAGLAALFPLFSPPGSVGIQAEGGLFWGAPGYAQRVQETLRQLLPAGQELAIMRQDNVNLVGTACAALK